MGRFRAEGDRCRGQPLRHRCRVVVDDVVDPAPPARDGGHGGLRRVLDVDERPHAAAAANYRELPLADLLDVLAAPAERGTGAIEAPVAQDDALGPAGARDRALEIADRIERMAHSPRRRGIERVVLGLERPAGAGEGPPREALGDEPAYSDCPAGGQQIVGPLRPQAVGRGEVSVEVADVERARKRGQLMHDHLGLGLGDRKRHLLGVERIGHHRGRTQSVDELSLGRGAGHACHLVAARHEPREKLPSERPRGAGDQDLHRSPLVGSCGVTRCLAGM